MPRLVEKLGGANLYNWVGSSYLLMSACTAPCKLQRHTSYYSNFDFLMLPVYGKLADIIGRKSCLIVAIGIFLLGSALYDKSPSLSIMHSRFYTDAEQLKTCCGLFYVADCKGLVAVVSSRLDKS